MSHPVKQHGVKTGVAEDDLQNIANGRIPLENRLEIFLQVFKHADSPLINYMRPDTIVADMDNIPEQNCQLFCP
jgi:hypothetical protein